MATTAVRTLRQATPERWRAALARAEREGVQVRQLVGSGAWLATSGTDATKAYELEIVNGIVRSCSCPAGTFGDPCCKHAARFYHLVGLLDLDPEPEPEPPTPAAPAPAAVPCWDCQGTGRDHIADARGRWHAVACLACEGTGIALAEPDDAGDADAPGEPDPAPAPGAQGAPVVRCARCGRGPLVKIQDKP